MSTPKVDFTISIGVIAQTLIFIFFLGVAWTRIESTQAKLQSELASHMSEVETLKKLYVRADVQDQKDKRIEEKFDEIQAGLKRIEAKLF